MKQYLNLQNIILLLLISWIVFPVFQITFTLNYKIMYSIIITIGSIGLLIFLLFLFKNIKSPKNNLSAISIPIIFFLLFLIWTLIACFQAENLELAFKGNKYRKEGFFTYLLYAGFFGISFLTFRKKLQSFSTTKNKDELTIDSSNRSFRYFSNINYGFYLYDFSKLSC